jgi:hypothetical protein
LCLVWLHGHTLQDQDVAVFVWTRLHDDLVHSQHSGVPMDDVITLKRTQESTIGNSLLINSIVKHCILAYFVDAR